LAFALGYQHVSVIKRDWIIGTSQVVSVDGTMNGRIKGFVIPISLTYTSMTAVKR